MALIKCHECGKQISDLALRCPYCGAESQMIIEKKEKARAKREAEIMASEETLKRTKRHVSIFLVVAFILLGFLGYNGYSEKQEWIALKESNDTVALNAFIRNHPYGLHKKDAYKRLVFVRKDFAEKLAIHKEDSIMWTSILAISNDEKKIEKLQQYIEDMPKGSHVQDANEMIAKIKSQKYVDLGLSVKWAKMNIGAKSPEDYGDYFAWGETKGYKSGKSNFSWDSYKWCKGANNTMTKYCADSDYGTVDNRTTLSLKDDAAHVNWGSNWRMPTISEIKELLEKCTWTETTQNGVKGYKFTSTINGNSIFLPNAGGRGDDELFLAGYDVICWSSSLSDLNEACILECTRNIYDQPCIGSSSRERYSGFSVRAVCP